MTRSTFVFKLIVLSESLSASAAHAAEAVLVSLPRRARVSAAHAADTVLVVLLHWWFTTGYGPSERVRI